MFNYFDLSLIVLLILSNGLFAMSEIAIVSSRKARLQQLEKEGRKGAQAAAKLHGEPARFFSTVQVGITSIGILSGAIGEEALTMPLREILANVQPLRPYAESLALTLTVVVLTYLSVVLGELVPKHLGMQKPERIAVLIAPFMLLLAKVASPVVWLLSSSSHVIQEIFGMHHAEVSSVTNEEIKIMMQQGAESGVFHEVEEHLVANVLRLDEQQCFAIMTPRTALEYLDLSADKDSIHSKLAQCRHSQMLVCRKGLDNVEGVLRRADLVQQLLSGEPMSIKSVLREPLYVPGSVILPHLVERFRSAQTSFAIVINEYGEVEGIVTLKDVLSAIVGDLPLERGDTEPEVMQRTDGSWLVDGSISLVRLKSLLDLSKPLPGETSKAYHTLAGFMIYFLEKIPRAADYFEYAGWRFEVVDMDQTRIDKVLLVRVGQIS